MSSTNDPPLVTINTNLLYGVFAPHKSFLIGFRKLVKHEYATWLAWKALVGRLPQEMIDMIAEELERLERDTVDKLWYNDAPFSENISRFSRAPKDTPSTIAAVCKIGEVAPGVHFTIISNDRPLRDRTPSARAKVSYIHISAAKQRPSLAINLPPNSPSVSRSPSTTLTYPTGGQGVVDVRLRPGHNHTSGLSQDSAEYRHCANARTGQHVQASRILQCDGVEEAMRDWDEDALKKFVKLLELKLVPFDGSDPMKPGLHILQTIVDQ